jgi:hypothetical protein
MTPKAAAAIETLRVAGFKLTSDSGSFRLVRSNGEQAEHGNLGPVTGNYDAACVKGLKVAQAVLKDEAARVKLGKRSTGKPLASDPYG